MTIDSPRPFEANAGVIAAHLPTGTDRVRILADGRSVRVLRIRGGRRVLLTQPLGLPSRDLTLRVEAYHGGKLLAARSVGSVFGLPRAALVVAPPRRLDGALQHEVRSLRSQTGVATSAWIRDLRRGTAAASNAGARFPSASTLKLGILLALFARSDVDPTAAGSWSLVRSMIQSSSNRAANQLLPSAGGAEGVNSLMASAGATATDMCCPYLLESDESLRSSNGMNREWLASGSQASGVIAPQPLLYRTEQQEAIRPQASVKPLRLDAVFRAPARKQRHERRHRQTPRGIPSALLSWALAPPVPPIDVTEQPTFPCCKYTTAHDLGSVLVSLVLASSGHGPLARVGLTPREARVAEWLLIHTDYPGLVRPTVPYVVGHKAGWLPDMQHDAALVFSPRGTIVVAVMTYSPAGVSYSRARDATARLMRVAVARQG